MVFAGTTDMFVASEDERSYWQAQAERREREFRLSIKAPGVASLEADVSDQWCLSPLLCGRSN